MLQVFLIKMRINKDTNYKIKIYKSSSSNLTFLRTDIFKDVYTERFINTHHYLAKYTLDAPYSVIEKFYCKKIFEHDGEYLTAYQDFGITSDKEIIDRIHESTHSLSHNIITQDYEINKEDL
jgi:hypothetical protein